jgi:hypothetical protein
MNLEIIQTKIYELRGRKIMLDFDLAELYQVETRGLNQSVKRNIERFPQDFMFQLDKREWTELITNCDKLPNNIKHNPTSPYAFTQEGVAMLSGILRSKIAIDVNINIMRAFVIMRHYTVGLLELNQKLDAFMADTNMQFYEVYQVLTELAEQKRESEKPRRPIGFRQSE